jgi:hypothetical protein
VLMLFVPSLTQKKDLKKLDASECFTEQTSEHTGGVTPSSSHSDNQSDQNRFPISICIDCFLAMIQICRSFIGSLNRSEAS